MTKLLIEKSDGTEEELTILDGSITNQYRDQSHADVEVIRSEWRDIEDSIDDIDDEFFIIDGGQKEFGGRLVDSTNKSDHVLVEIGSFEEDALDAEPTGPTLEFVGVPDSDIVENAIDRIPELTAGTIETIDNDVSVLFSNSSPAGMIRELQKSTRALIRYNQDKTVDYIEKPDTITARIGPDESNVEDSFDVSVKERDKFNHVRVLGSQEGQARIEAEAVLDSYDGGREIWRKYSDKSINKESRAQTIANEIATEADEEDKRVRVETVVFGEQFSVGDRVETVSVQDNLDQVLRVIKKTDRLEGATTVSKLELSSRIIIDESDEQKRRRDVERFNQGFQGDVVTINSGGYRAPVDDGSPYVFSVRKPDDVVKELTAEIEIDALPYRAYSSGAASAGGSHNHSVSIDIGDHDHDFSISIPDHNHGFTVPSHNHDVTITVPNHIHGLTDDAGSYVSVPTSTADGHEHLYDKAVLTGLQSEAETETNTSDDGGFVSDSTDDGGGTFESSTTDDGGGFFTSETTSNEAGEHTHDPDPGVIEFDDLTPSDVEVVVNGDVVASGVGSGNFTEVVDIAGSLTDGFNTVEVRSSGLGHIRATAFLDLYRQITQ